MSEAGFASLGPTLLARKGGAKPAMRPQLTPLAHSPEEMAALADEQLEDLGWNDMGEDGHEGEPDASSGADIVPIRAQGASPHADSAARSPVVRRQQKELLDRVLAEAAMDGSEGELGEEEDLSARFFDDPGAGDAADTGEGADPGKTSDERAFDDGPFENGPFENGAFENGAGGVGTPAHDAPSGAGAHKAVRRAAARPAGKRAAFTLRLDTERHLKLRLAATMQGVSAQALVTEALDAMLAEFEELDALAARMRRG